MAARTSAQAGWSGYHTGRMTSIAHLRRGRLLRALLALAAGMTATGVTTACETGGLSDEQASVLTRGGSVRRGAAAIDRLGCGACHLVPGVPGAHGQVGPPLAGIGERAYIAGVLSNTADNMVRWIVDPRGVDSLTAMPDVGATEREARDIAAYLYSSHGR